MGLLMYIRRRLFVPGELISMLGFDFNAQTVRFFDGWLKYSNGLFKRGLTDEGVDGRTAQPFLFMKRITDLENKRFGRFYITFLFGITITALTFISFLLFGMVDAAVVFISVAFVLLILRNAAMELPDKATWLNLEKKESEGSYIIRVNPKLAPILDTGEKPEGLVFLVDYQSATGVAFDHKGNPEHPTSNVQLNGQIEIQRDPILTKYKTNPEVYGVSNDVAISAEILRTRVRMWKTIIFIIGAFLFGMLIGSGM